MRFWRSVLRNQRIRVAVYLLVVVGLFLARGPQWWKDAIRSPSGSSGASGRLVVAGADLAPTLAEALATSYERDYPQVTIERRGGGTTHALQALFDGEAQVALLARPPLASEFAHFERADGAPLLFEPIALAGLALLTSSASPLDSLDVAALKTMLAASIQGTTSTPRFYAEDPNLGWWDALLEQLELPLTANDTSTRVVFVRSRTELEQALRDDPRAIGLMSSVFLPFDRAPDGLKLVHVRSENHAAVLPTHANVGHGRYPLRHSLFVACRARARGDASKFVTFASGARGQRLLDRAGFLPARHFLREILLDERPIGAR